MSLHNVKERKTKRIMRKPLTSKDRENYVHKLSWEYSPSLKKMVWVERQERL
jgi:hypothetical protein